MKWRKLGKIFDPNDYELPNSCVQFAQAPQALVFDDFVRIYFSTRAADTDGTFLSHIAYVDIEKDFKTIIRISSKTVLPLGELGAFDEHGIFPLNVVRKDEREIYGYISGLNRRVSVSIDASIGLAISKDNGETFTRYGNGPILTSSLHEPFLVCDPFVKKLEDTYHMWYVYGLKWVPNAEKDSSPSRVYKIGHATSTDGIEWLKEGSQIVADTLNSDECQALPTVFSTEGTYHMYFCYRQSVDFRRNKDNGYRLGYAYSTDLKTWKRADEDAGIDLSADGWDSEMMCYPHVFNCDGKTYLLYNGNEFGRHGFGIAELVTE